jgi:hypothetical protein
MKTATKKKKSNLIKRTDAYRLIKNYQSKQFDSIISDGRRAGKYVLFERKALSDFIKSLPAECNKIRIYFATTDPLYTGPPNATDTEYGNCMTVILVGTKPSNGYNIDLIDDDKMNFEDQELIGIAAGLNQPGFDFGTLCPPETLHSVNPADSLAREVYGN